MAQRRRYFIQISALSTFDVGLWLTMVIKGVTERWGSIPGRVLDKLLPHLRKAAGSKITRGGSDKK